MSQLTVSKLASQVGTSTDTLRYYERIGLLPEPDRSPAGYRLYGHDAADRVRFIKRAQRFGLRLEEIGELLQIRERGLCPCGRTKRLLEERVAELSEEMAALQRLRDDIQQMLDEHLPGADGDGWQCGSSLIQVGRRSNTERGDHRECF
ncbi:MAG: heavy metal-responsive transcriptional regulator [Actinomycetota bacterium]|nr:heavy metal-responsive transcriptional regulator [Actinomycetota bacterium]